MVNATDIVCVETELEIVLKDRDRQGNLTLNADAAIDTNTNYTRFITRLSLESFV